MKQILKYFPSLTDTQIQQFQELERLYNEWNEKINVISRKDIEFLYTRHVLHSLSIAQIIKFQKNTKILDVGTGGGFPGIPLAILFPKASFYLIDSIGKKITVVKEISNSLNLKNVSAEKARVEELKTKYDFIISRAVKAFPKFISLCRDRVSTKNINSIKNGILYLKGGEFSEEIATFKKRIKIYSISDFFEVDFFETKKIIYLPMN